MRTDKVFRFFNCLHGFLSVDDALFFFLQGSKPIDFHDASVRFIRLPSPFLFFVAPFPSAISGG